MTLLSKISLLHRSTCRISRTKLIYRGSFLGNRSKNKGNQTTTCFTDFKNDVLRVCLSPISTTFVRYAFCIQQKLSQFFSFSAVVNYWLLGWLMHFFRLRYFEMIKLSKNARHPLGSGSWIGFRRIFICCGVVVSALHRINHDPQTGTFVVSHSTCNNIDKIVWGNVEKGNRNAQAHKPTKWYGMEIVITMLPSRKIITNI